MRQVEFPEALAFLFEPSRYKVAYGGRGGAKSWAAARALLILGAQRPMRILCAREIQRSIKDSVHRLLAEQVEALGMRSVYSVLETEIRGANGTQFVFAGLRTNVDSIKSMEGLDVAWVEEAHTVSDKSLEVLIPTVRKEGSEIWFTFNPDLESDPVYQRFVASDVDGAIVRKVNWQDNPWFPEVLREEKDRLYASDAEKARHVWGGELNTTSDAEVLRGRYSVEAFEPGKGWHGPYYGADWGFSVDPTTLIRCWVHDRTLYVDQEAYGQGIDVDLTPALFDMVPGAKKHVIRADSARPETISYMRRHGYPLISGVIKGPGSVEDGVEHLRSYERIVIHPRCPETAREAHLWRYKVDKLTGDVMPKLVDANNHCWDAIRYALAPIIRAGKPVPVTPRKAPKRKRGTYDERRTSGDSWKTV